MKGSEALAHSAQRVGGPQRLVRAQSIKLDEQKAALPASTVNQLNGYAVVKKQKSKERGLENEGERRTWNQALALSSWSLGCARR